MADKTSEQLSALVDGECEVSELELALRRLAKDPDLMARWHSYHLISDTMKNTIPEVIDAGFTERVKKTIDITPPLPSAPTRPSWYKPAAGFALAASVTLAVLVGLRLTQTPDVTANSDTPIAVTHPPQQLSTPQVADRDLESRLNRYLVNHNEYASRNSVNGMLSYVRMVGYQPRR